jgi:predicted nuclease of predicted toxin-antitoxin system
MTVVYSELGNYDFNDVHYLAQVQMNKHFAVADDADFFKSNKLGIKILTANK